MFFKRPSIGISIVSNFNQRTKLGLPKTILQRDVRWEWLNGSDRELRQIQLITVKLDFPYQTLPTIITKSIRCYLSEEYDEIPFFNAQIFV